MKHMNGLLLKMQTEFEKSVEAVRAEAQRMDSAAAAGAGGKVAVITMCPMPAALNQSLASFGSTSSFMPAHWSVCAKNAARALDKALADNEAQHALNIPLLENNARVIEQVHRIMENLGIPAVRTTYGYATARARKMTQQRVTAGYVADLAAVCKTDDGYSSVVKKCDDFEKRLLAFEAAERLKEQQLEQAKAAEQAERAKLTLLGALAHKYSCGAQYDDVINAMSQRDKYFGLGYWLYRCRNHWEGGPDRAQRGLDLFEVVTPEDREVYDAVSTLVEDWDGDGRVFRDSAYNYDVLFAKADPNVFADFGKLEAVDLVPTD